MKPGRYGYVDEPLWIAQNYKTPRELPIASCGARADRIALVNACRFRLPSGSRSDTCSCRRFKVGGDRDLGFVEAIRRMQERPS
jgi:hypothetical protein